MLLPATEAATAQRGGGFELKDKGVDVSIRKGELHVVSAGGFGIASDGGSGWHEGVDRLGETSGAGVGAGGMVLQVAVAAVGVEIKRIDGTELAEEVLLPGVIQQVGIGVGICSDRRDDGINGDDFHGVESGDGIGIGIAGHGVAGAVVQAEALFEDEALAGGMGQPGEVVIEQATVVVAVSGVVAA